MALEDKYNKWLKSFKKKYSKIKPTMLDAFKGAYIMAIEECLELPNFTLSKQEVDDILQDIFRESKNK